jgi:hypothetical protein
MRRLPSRSAARRHRQPPRAGATQIARSSRPRPVPTSRSAQAHAEHNQLLGALRGANRRRSGFGGTQRNGVPHESITGDPGATARSSTWAAQRTARWSPSAWCGRASMWARPRHRSRASHARGRTMGGSIWLGDGSTWVHPEGMRSTCAHAPRLVARQRRAELVTHVLNSPQGRLLVSYYIRSAGTTAAPPSNSGPRMGCRRVAPAPRRARFSAANRVGGRAVIGGSTDPEGHCSCARSPGAPRVRSWARGDLPAAPPGRRARVTALVRWETSALGLELVRGSPWRAVNSWSAGAVVRDVIADGRPYRREPLEHPASRKPSFGEAVGRTPVGSRRA